MRSRPRWSAALALAFSLSVASLAHAANNPAAAQALFEEARVLMASGNYAAGCAKLEGSQALDPGPGTQYNLALCYEKSGRTASAWATYLESAAAYKATNRVEWETRARDRAAALAGTLSRVTIVVPAGAPRDLEVTRDRVPVVASELGTAIPVDPGPHVVDATAPGHRPFHVSFELARGTSQRVEVSLAGSAATPAPEPEAPSSGRRTLAYVVAGVGVVGLSVGAVAGLVAMGKNGSSTDTCPNDGVCRDSSALRDNRVASDWATVSTISFIAGGALVAAGVVLFVTAPKSGASAASRPFVAPTLGLGSAGLAGAW